MTCANRWSTFVFLASLDTIGLLLFASGSKLGAAAFEASPRPELAFELSGLRMYCKFPFVIGGEGPVARDVCGATLCEVGCNERFSAESIELGPLVCSNLTFGV